MPKKIITIKTEVCLYYKHDHPMIEIEINVEMIRSKSVMNVMRNVKMTE